MTKEKRIDYYQNLLATTLITAVFGWFAIIGIVVVVAYYDGEFENYLLQLALLLWISVHSHSQLSKIIDRSKLEGLNVFEEFEDK